MAYTPYTLAEVWFTGSLAKITILLTGGNLTGLSGWCGGHYQGLIATGDVPLPVTIL